MNQYLENCESQNKSVVTIQNYRADLNKFILWFEATVSLNLTSIRSEHIKQYQEFLSQGGYVYERQNWFSRFLFKKGPTALWHQPSLAVSSRKRHLSSVKNFFEYLKQTYEEKQKIFRINPVKSKLHAIRLKEKDIQSTPLLTTGHWYQIFQLELSIKERFLTTLLYWGGLRLQELTQLKKSDFNFDNYTIRLIRKGGDVHFLKIQNGPEIFQLFKHYNDTLRTNKAYLFPRKGLGDYPISTKTMYNQIRDVFAKAQCPSNLGPHSFRKACATNLYHKTKDLLLVRDYLNHKDAKVTQTYIVNK